MVSNRTKALARWAGGVFVIGSVVGAQPAAAVGDPFFDDFSDMNISDDAPVSWLASSGIVLDASSGDLVVTSDPPRAGALADHPVLDTEFDNGSIRTQVRLLTGEETGSGPGHFVGVFARESFSPQFAVGAGISPNGELSIALGVGAVGSPDDITLATVATDLDVFSTDIHLKFDFFGPSLALTAWADGTPEPSIPQLTAMDDTILSRRSLGVIGQRGFASTTAFRFFEVVPEPTTALLFGLGLLGFGAKRRLRSG